MSLAGPLLVARSDRGAVTLLSSDGPIRASVPPALHHDHPVIGDWVAVHGDPPVVFEVLPRRSALTRAAAGPTTRPQVLAANVDLVLVVAALDTPLNLRRLERTLAAAWSSGAVPAVVLTKADTCFDPDEAVADARAVALGTEVVAVSAHAGDGVDDVLALVAGRTVVLLGPSGSGKTTLVNRLTGADLAVREVRRDGKGRHTTTAGQLVPLPGGGMLLDTPGLRELALWDDGEGVEAAFADVAALAGACRFGDCAHDTEPGCAVRDAIAPERLASWHKLQREIAHLAARHDARLAAEERRRNRAFGRLQRSVRSRP